ncbi:MAG: methyltransferase domain-containing protein [Nocardioidaceae bacterium]
MSKADTDASVFDRAAGRMAALPVRAGWARIRYTVVAAHVVDRCLQPMGPGLRILDFGGGDGADSIRLARLGHHVTIADYSAAMLTAARAQAAESGVVDRLATVQTGVAELAEQNLRDFDVVLCHFVIRYVADPPPLFLAVARCLRPGGLLPHRPNPAGPVLAAAVRDVDPAAAFALLSAATVATATFSHEVALIDSATATRYLEAADCNIVGRYGARAVIDLIADSAAKYDPDTYADIERLELAVCDPGALP